MIRAVLDANQFVSALLKPLSNSGSILTLIRDDKIRLLVSDDIISEVTGVLLYPKIKKRINRSPEYIASFMDKLWSAAIVTKGALKINAIADDPGDDKYLSCALEGKADFIVSGDHHLLNLKTFKGIRIVDPAFFLAIVLKERK